MAKAQKRILLKDLNLTNRFLFDEVMEDPQAHQAALSIIFGQDIPLLSQNETEKELRLIRLWAVSLYISSGMSRGTQLYFRR